MGCPHHPERAYLLKEGRLVCPECGYMPVAHSLSHLIKQSEIQLHTFIEEKHKLGLTYPDILRILVLEIEQCLLKFEAETQIR